MFIGHHLLDLKPIVEEDACRSVYYFFIVSHCGVACRGARRDGSRARMQAATVVRLIVIRLIKAACPFDLSNAVADYAIYNCLCVCVCWCVVILTDIDTSPWLHPLE